MPESLRSRPASPPASTPETRHGNYFAQAFHASPALLAVTRLDDGTIIETNTAFLRRLTDDPDFAAARLHTGFLDEHPAIMTEPVIDADLMLRLIAAAALSTRAVRDAADAVPEIFSAMGAWRN